MPDETSEPIELDYDKLQTAGRVAQMVLHYEYAVLELADELCAELSDPAYISILTDDDHEEYCQEFYRRRVAAGANPEHLLAAAEVFRESLRGTEGAPVEDLLQTLQNTLGESVRVVFKWLFAFAEPIETYTERPVFAWTEAARAIGDRTRSSYDGRESRVDALRDVFNMLDTVLGLVGMEAAPAPSNEGSWNNEAPPSRRRGRPKDTDPKRDASIAEAWKGGHYKSYREALPILQRRWSDLTESELYLIVDRHRKR